MKNKLLKCIFTVFLMFSSVMVAFGINSDSEIPKKQAALKAIYKYDFSTLISKNELIGFRLGDFKSKTAQYQSGVQSNIQRINNDYTQINLVRQSNEISDSEKDIHISRLYQDVDSALYDVDAKTITYLVSLRDCLSSITYQRFLKKYQTYYNSLRVSDSTINLQY